MKGILGRSGGGEQIPLDLLPRVTVFKRVSADCGH
jgi:hypothetical protein